MSLLSLMDSINESKSRGRNPHCECKQCTYFFTSALKDPESQPKILKNIFSRFLMLRLLLYIYAINDNMLYY